MPLTPIYVTRDDFLEYSEGAVAGDVNALDRLLARAESDIDSKLPFVGELTDDRKLVPDELTDTQLYYLKRAVCAQAEYRQEMGEKWFRRAQRDSYSAPGFSAQGKLPRVSPKALQELRQCDLLPSGIRASAGPGARESWPLRQFYGP